MITETYNFTSPVITLGEENTIHDALLLMQKHEIQRIVIAEEDIPIGIITERDFGNFLDKDKTVRTLDKIQLKEIMNKNPITIMNTQNDHLTQCANRMETFQIGSVIVINDSRKIVGITTRTDLVRNFSNLYNGLYKIKDYMTKKIITCRKNDTIMYVLRLLNTNKISRIVVTDNSGKPLGVISYDTFLKNSAYFKNTKYSGTRNYVQPEKSEMEKQVWKLIGNELISVESEEDLAKAARLMTLYKVSGIPTMDAEGNLEGMISSSDIVRAYSEVETHARLIKKDPHFI